VSKARALVATWLLIDFFGEARRAGKGQSSSLTTTIFTQSFLAFVFAALLYPDTPPVPFAAANLCLSSLLVAIGSLGDDSRPERRAADELLLRGSPLGRWTVAVARAGHAAFANMLVTVGMALPPAILYAFLTRDAWRLVTYVVAACLCSALAAGALGVLARASWRWIGLDRTALLMGSLRAVALGGGLVLFALGLPRLQATADAMPLGRTAIELLPPTLAAKWLWDPVGGAWRLGVLVAAGLLLLGAAMAIGTAGEASRGRRRHASPLLRLLQRITPAGPARAIAEFTAVGMWRSPGFRARVLPLLGVPTAMVFLAMRGSAPEHAAVSTGVVLQLPAIYLPFLVMFLPRADQPGTAWVFDNAPRLGIPLVQDAVWRALTTHVLLPIHGTALVAALVLGGRGGLAIVPAAAFAAGLAVFAARLATRPLQRVPFTVAGDAEGSPELGSMFGLALVLGGLAVGFATQLPVAWQCAVAATALAAGVAGLLRPSPAAGPGTTMAEDASDPGPGETLVDGGQPAGPNGGPPPSAEPAVGGEDAAELTAARPPSLRGELRAILVLYGVLSVLPALVGTIFAA